MLIYESQVSASKLYMHDDGDFAAVEKQKFESND